MFILIIIVKLKSSPSTTISNIMTRISTSTPSLLPDVPNDNINIDQAASLDPLPLAAKVWFFGTPFICCRLLD